MSFKECPYCFKTFNSLGYAGHRAMHKREWIKEVFKLREEGLSDKKITKKLGLNENFIKYFCRRTHD